MSEKNKYLREATKSDCDMIYHWANEKSVRANSFHSQSIQYEEHLKWFETNLQDAKKTSIFL